MKCENIPTQRFAFGDEGSLFTLNRPVGEI